MDCFIPVWLFYYCDLCNTFLLLPQIPSKELGGWRQCSLANLFAWGTRPESSEMFSGVVHIATSYLYPLHLILITGVSSTIFQGSFIRKWAFERLHSLQEIEPHEEFCLVNSKAKFISFLLLFLYLLPFPLPLPLLLPLLLTPSPISLFLLFSSFSFLCFLPFLTLSS